MDLHIWDTTEACIRPSTRNPTLRFLLVGIALVLRNVWG